MRKLLLAAATLGAVSGLGSAGYAATLTPNAPIPAPGSITVSLGGKFFTGLFLGQGSRSSYDGNKRSAFQLVNYFRLLPSFDATLPNGLQYGAAAEIRSVAASGTRSSSQNTLFWQRAYGYIGSEKLGRVLFGSAVTAVSKAQVGLPCYNTCGWDGEYGFNTAGLSWLLSDNHDNVQGLSYYSPSFFGLQALVSYVPVDQTLSNSQFSVYRTDGTNAPTNIYRAKDRVEGALKYGGTFGPVGVSADVGYIWSDKVKSTGFSAASYRNLSVFDAGLSLTYAGFELDGHLDTGHFDGGYNPVPRGTPTTTAWTAGLQYTFGPFTVGGSYYDYTLGNTNTSQAAFGNRKRDAYGIGAGGTYAVAPGFNVYLDALYGHQKEANFNIIDGVAGSPVSNKVDARGVGLGASFTW